jgi:hypothetical protein
MSRLMPVILRTMPGMVSNPRRDFRQASMSCQKAVGNAWLGAGLQKGEMSDGHQGR